ncbi:uncharacterized protein MAM_00426 [Metarhizium album ARSEF 1941]|uniref:Tat pathway signal sequence n=1 Tax=Metarhizium album (strain ARSEF 1941) TaxID=1081103 RepID=A0A0B2X7E6_METAS|nr:uncharacterized protein MAM_00426 [Metarhizium album ARSEF 1941]KHO01425.1 hypothetical protein MAM_00426 [Metarhizium album ARSEF 1941]
MWSGSSEYERLKSLEREYDGLQEEGCEPTRRSTVRLPTRLVAALLVCNVLLFLSSAYLLWVATFGRPAASEWECAQTVSPWSPVWEAVEFWEGNFDNDFTHPSKYRGPPTRQLQQNWDDLWGVRGIGVSRDDLRKLNKTDVDRYVEVHGSDPGNPTYAAAIEAQHQLHCLNVIRQYTWPLDMYDKAWGKLYPAGFEDTATARVHVDHCIETLRLSLMCYADVTPALLMRNPVTGGRRTDFNTHHKCRDFQKILDYIGEHGTQTDPR